MREIAILLIIPCENDLLLRSTTAIPACQST